MKRFLASSALAIWTATQLAGCYQVRYSVQDSATPIEATDGQGNHRYHFKEEGRNWYLFWGLVPVSQVNTDAMLSHHMIKGTKIGDLQLTEEWGGTDILITLAINIAGGFFTAGALDALGIYTRTVTCEGDVINDQEQAQ